ncbi:hypothetical protein ET445_11230 [Agromyces protaetiae]|uniref:Peptidase S11 D-alanyl-D-alanine carboxypeptidase A N-terminal domain-containing protein n=1 Tax=Agromyces protaetiae TaxID=2509455 RepID=A0A4P6FCP3_9MICO|nr:hypothetical protein [Agromyces protaetiae]QAY73832.1 hypothetical protein ET445_11230 [Agromyces protaetiae]
MPLTPGRVVGIAVGALAILGIGVYGPAMLLGPLPAVTVVPAAAAAADVPAATSITLPDVGASATVALDETGAASTVATAGDTAVVPIGGAAKLVTVLATLDGMPLGADSAGPDIKIGPEDYTDFLRYQSEGSRTLQVSPGDTWSERDVVRAVLLASSNNHADTLARWAFGSPEQYVTAANEWLAANGFTQTRVADATGLSGDDVGTAEEVAKLGALVVAHPVLASILAGEGPTGVGVREIPDVVSYEGGPGVRALVRSFTDQAAISFVFASTVPGSAGAAAARFVTAMVLIPDYDTLEPAVAAVVASSGTTAVTVDVIAAGTSFGAVRSAWGDRADLVASATRSGNGWSAATGEPALEVEAFTTAKAGQSVGTVTVETPDGALTSPLELSASIDDPGPLWRLANPGAIIDAYLTERGD